MGGSVSRRAVLRTTSLALAGLTIGCLGTRSDATSTTRPQIQASFVVLGDFCTNIVGDAVSVETLVPIGQHGHGWEPGPGIQRDVLESDAFVYNGPGFQPWADDLVDALAHDAPEIAVINARRDIALLPLTPAPTTDDHGGTDAAKNEGHSDNEEPSPGHDNGKDNDAATIDDGHDHSGGDVDPHYWLDPTRANRAVETLHDDVTALLPEHTDRITDATTTYRDALDALDETIDQRLTHRSHDIALVAGHNSFRYLGDRYGFEVHAIAGGSPDDYPSPRDITRAERLIHDNGIDTILTPVFESDRAARLLLEETPATDIQPVTAIPTLTTDWADKNWGYIDIMREINLPAFAAALGAA